MGDHIQAENKQKIEDICNINSNYTCADCSASGANWASVNHGVFICIRCSGIHRNLGTHISKVKSVSMDDWLTEEIELMSLLGNNEANKLLEANLPNNYVKPVETDNSTQLQEFISKKYKDKCFIRKDFYNHIKCIYKQVGYKGIKMVKAKNYKSCIKENMGLFGLISVPTEKHDEVKLKYYNFFGIS